MIKTILITAFLALAPISELRGAIPYAMAMDIPFYFAYFLGVFFNALVAPLVYIFLNTFHKIFYKRMHWYQNFFDRFVQKAQNKIHDKVEKYGYWGILIFVAIPLPITGAYTGTLGSWILGLDKKKTMLAVIGGVMISGIIVTTVVSLGLSGLDFLLADPVVSSVESINEAL